MPLRMLWRKSFKAAQKKQLVVHMVDEHQVSQRGACQP